MFGFEIDPTEIHPLLKPHQLVAVQWAIKGGRRALFEAFGLGKTFQQIEILRLITKHKGGRALIVAPLGIRQEFICDGRDKLGVEIKFIRRIEEAGETGIYITNYETVRDGKLDPAQFVATTLDEAAILRGFGGTKTFREFMRLFENVQYRFVATATPDPNEYIEILAYAAYLGIMEVGEGKTRFFKRDATKADTLTLLEHREEDFWLWVASWALFLQSPADLGFDPVGYDLPEMIVHRRMVRIDAERSPVREYSGQYRMFQDAALNLVTAAREKRESIKERVEAVREIMAAHPGDHFLIWHDLEKERIAIEEAIPNIRSATGDPAVQTLEAREDVIGQFSRGEIQNLSTKPVLAGSGCNFQRFCHRAIFCGIGFKFSDFFQAIHRIYRFLQTKQVHIYLVFSENEQSVLEVLLEKWERHKEKVKRMQQIIKEFGLSELALAQALTRAIGCERVEVSGVGWQMVNNDSVVETARLDDNSVGLVLTSIPFSTQYEYTPSLNDFGHTDSNEHFFQQMDFLTPELKRVMIPGRIAAIHVKDRIVPGGINGFGVQSVYPFHCDAIAHFIRHGFVFMGMKTITTDVVRENNQTYRLGWTEQCKDGTKMGYGMPEYLLLFRKPQSNTEKGYGDIPVVKSKKRYSKARWQLDAHGFTRSSGDRPYTPEEIMDMPLSQDFHQKMYGMFHDFYSSHAWNWEHAVKIGEALEARGVLPVTFMLLQPPSVYPDVWTDITRMLTANLSQVARKRQKHLCPMQFDLADRVITQMSNEGDLVYDPFAGVGTVPMRAVALRRRGLGVELNGGYFADACSYCAAEERKVDIPSLFDSLPEDGVEES